VTELNEELKTLNLSFLCTSVDEMDGIRWKSIILTSLESTLNQEDMARARDSRHHQYFANILKGHHVKDIIPIIGLSKAMMIAQTRLNVGKFYWKGAFQLFLLIEYREMLFLLLRRHRRRLPPYDRTPNPLLFTNTFLPPPPTSTRNRPRKRREQNNVHADQ
jgi:hypothetical protein